jgi:PIN domain nuclease of toxin-antitoxin system
MRMLLDTHVLLWWQVNDPRLSQKARAVLANPQHGLLISIASFWEISIKHRLGKLGVSGGEALSNAQALGCSVLAISPDHITVLDSLPQHALHRDPFDHLILAQAKSEGISLLTGDRKMTGYGVSCVGVG